MHLETSTMNGQRTEGLHKEKKSRAWNTHFGVKSVSIWTFQKEVHSSVASVVRIAKQIENNNVHEVLDDQKDLWKQVRSNQKVPKNMANSRMYKNDIYAKTNMSKAKI